MEKIERFVSGAFLIVAVFLAVDLYDDSSHGADLNHIVFEGTALLVSLIMLSTIFLRYLRDLRQKTEASVITLKNLTVERDRWKAHAEQYLRGLSQAIDAQFEVWRLSASEREIGLLILKGFSHKEIAALRNTSERTVRQQGAAIYSKAGLENKAQLSAFFLEDLFLPSNKDLKIPPA